MTESENQTAETASDVENNAEADNQKSGCLGLFYDGKPWEAFKSVALIFSFIVNLVFFIVL
mgnify:FL=1